MCTGRLLLINPIFPPESATPLRPLRLLVHSQVLTTNYSLAATTHFHYMLSSPIENILVITSFPHFRVLTLSYSTVLSEATSLDLNTPFSWSRHFAPAAGRWQIGVDCEWNVEKNSFVPQCVKFSGKKYDNMLSW
jgi:hypothetical protein